MGEDLVVFVHVRKPLLRSCVGARLTLAGCLKLILETSLVVFVISRASCPRMTLPSGQVAEVDLGVWICLGNAVWLPGSGSSFPWTSPNDSVPSACCSELHAQLHVGREHTALNFWTVSPESAAWPPAAR